MNQSCNVNCNIKNFLSNNRAHQQISQQTMPNEALPFHKWDKHFMEYAEKRWTKFPTGRTS